MGIIINLIAAIILFFIPVKAYYKGQDKIVKNPFDKDGRMYISLELYFLVYSVLTAMVFLGPFSLVKYGFWIVFLLFLLFSGKIKIKIDAIVGAYLLFLAWAVISTLVMSDAKYAASMLLIKYSLPLLYLWLSYAAINDSYDLMFFLKATVVGMCIYALFIGGFAVKFLMPIWLFLCFKSGGLFLSYAPMANFFSGLIVIPLCLFLVTKQKKWLYAALWISMSTVLDTVRTGIGGLFLAGSFFLVTIFKGKSIPWIGALLAIGIGIIFTVPSFREKTFKNKDTELSNFSASDANFDNIESNAREFLWEMNMENFYYPAPTTGSGLGSVANFMKTTERTTLEQIHSDYVQILCDLGLIGIILFGLFVVIAICEVTAISWKRNCPLVLKLTGGMALGSCAGIFFSMAFDNVVATAQQSLVIPFIMLGIYLKVKDLYFSGEWN